MLAATKPLRFAFRTAAASVRRQGYDSELPTTHAARAAHITSTAHRLQSACLSRRCAISAGAPYLLARRADVGYGAYFRSVTISLKSATVVKLDINAASSANRRFRTPSSSTITITLSKNVSNGLRSLAISLSAAS